MVDIVALGTILKWLCITLMVDKVGLIVVLIVDTAALVTLVAYKMTLLVILVTVGGCKFFYGGSVNLVHGLNLWLPK